MNLHHALFGEVPCSALGWSMSVSARWLQERGRPGYILYNSIRHQHRGEDEKPRTHVLPSRQYTSATRHAGHGYLPRSLACRQRYTQSYAISCHFSFTTVSSLPLLAGSTEFSAAVIEFGAPRWLYLRACCFGVFLGLDAPLWIKERQPWRLLSPIFR